jgi:2-polyprenyl-6-methoxyphenol hydroxylase-like FAD-dependent oxidoreductase
MRRAGPENIKRECYENPDRHRWSRPIGLAAGHLLRRAELNCVLIERLTQDYVLSRIRAGVLETVTTGLMTKLMQSFAGDGTFDHRRQAAELDYIAGSKAMQTAIAENYVGLPL